MGGVFFCVCTEESPLDRKGQEGVGAQPLAGGNSLESFPKRHIALLLTWPLTAPWSYQWDSEEGHFPSCSCSFPGTRPVAEGTQPPAQLPAWLFSQRLKQAGLGQVRSGACPGDAVSP